MASSDLLINLVKAAANNDRPSIREATEQIINAERAKNHHVLADRLEAATSGDGYQPTGPANFTLLQNSNTRFIYEVKPKRKLEELFLSDITRQACNELIEEQQKADTLRAHSLEPRHRILLIGPPGNGKTTLAETIAESLSVPFLLVRYELLIGSYLGKTASRLTKVYEYARQMPCVLFFDEFDTIGKERGDPQETGEIKRVVSSLLMQMDALPSYTIVVAASNHAELLDRAIWRRFQLRLELDAPTWHDRTQYFERFAATVSGTLGLEAETLAERVGDVSYAEVEEFCWDAHRRHILGEGNKTWEDVISECLELWEARSKVNLPIYHHSGKI